MTDDPIHEAYQSGRADQYDVDQRAVDAEVDQAVEVLRRVYPLALLAP